MLSQGKLCHEALCTIGGAIWVQTIQYNILFHLFGCNICVRSAYMHVFWLYLGGLRAHSAVRHYTPLEGHYRPLPYSTTFYLPFMLPKLECTVDISMFFASVDAD